MDGLQWKTLLKWMIWGYHHSRKHPFVSRKLDASSLMVRVFRQIFWMPFPVVKKILNSRNRNGCNVFSKSSPSREMKKTAQWLSRTRFIGFMDSFSSITYLRIGSVQSTKQSGWSWSNDPCKGFPIANGQSLVFGLPGYVYNTYHMYMYTIIDILVVWDKQLEETFGMFHVTVSFAWESVEGLKLLAGARLKHWNYIL